MYNFSIDPLIRALQRSLTGIQVRGQANIKCLAFADDCVIGASSNSDVKITQDLFLYYEKASQSKLNTGKSQVMSLNTSVIKPPKGMQIPKGPIHHLGILINNSGTADFLLKTTYFQESQHQCQNGKHKTLVPLAEQN